MKLVEIKNVRVGQIYQSIKHQNHYKVVTDLKTRNEDVRVKRLSNCINPVCYMGYPQRYFEERNKLFGFIGITHKIEDNRLFEIKREGFYIEGEVIKPVGDCSFCVITKIEDNEINVVWASGSVGLLNKNQDISTIGIYGVTHEFVNDSEG